MSQQDLLFVFEEDTELSPPKPSLGQRLSTRFSRKPFTERFIRGLDLGERTEQFQADIDFTKRLYTNSPMVCINLLVGVAARQLSAVQQLVFFRNLLVYERLHLKRQSVEDHLTFILGIENLSEYLATKRH
jgi:hypothetical protein